MSDAQIAMSTNERFTPCRKIRSVGKTRVKGAGWCRETKIVGLRWCQRTKNELTAVGFAATQDKVLGSPPSKVEVVKTKYIRSHSPNSTRCSDTFLGIIRFFQEG